MADIIQAGIEDKDMYLMCSIMSVFVTVAQRFVLSDIGDILSPKYAPETIAPTVIAGLIPKPFPTPNIATPTVPIVPPQDVPIIIETTLHKANVINKNNLGEITLSPTTRTVGTVPEASHAPIKMPTDMIIAAGARHSLPYYRRNLPAL